MISYYGWTLFHLSSKNFCSFLCKITLITEHLNLPTLISQYNRKFLGGFKLELLDADESVITTLTPGDQFVDDDPTQQSSELQLPEDECVGCAVGDHTHQTLSLFWYSQATGYVITLSLMIFY